MVERTIKIDILISINKYIDVINKYFNIDAVILFGSYASGNEREESDIDLAIILDDFEDVFDTMADLMGYTWNTDARIEPHPIRKKDFENESSYFIKEIINTGIKVA